MNPGGQRKRRLFVGLALDAATRATCTNAIDALRRTGLAARYEDPAKLHVTLAFLGNVEEARCDRVAAIARDIAAGTAPFEVVFDRVGAFPHERKPRIVYVGAREQGEAFRSLSQRLRARYSELGFIFEDDAVAHVTIARTKPPYRALPLIDVAPASLPVRTLTLFESVSDKQKATSRYLEAAQMPLAFAFFG
ncbi:MAG TPA: RNA 2',3'-cyclic phosphodiesterase [Candidatus Baltobacteraceae bacterium]|nr:RNA 2',3'-cyclic phosphodiesterase [Candidatus Baltobacteraceae bacterium]